MAFCHWFRSDLWRRHGQAQVVAPGFDAITMAAQRGVRLCQTAVLRASLREPNFSYEGRVLCKALSVELLAQARLMGEGKDGAIKAIVLGRKVAEPSSLARLPTSGVAPVLTHPWAGLSRNQRSQWARHDRWRPPASTLRATIQGPPQATPSSPTGCRGHGEQALRAGLKQRDA